MGETVEWSEGELLGLSARGEVVCGGGVTSPEMVIGDGADGGGSGGRWVKRVNQERENGRERERKISTYLIDEGGEGSVWLVPAGAEDEGAQEEGIDDEEAV